MKSLTEPAVRVVSPAQVQITLLVQGVSQDAKHAFYDLCLQAGREVLTKIQEADRVASWGAKRTTWPQSS